MKSKSISYNLLYYINPASLESNFHSVSENNSKNKSKNHMEELDLRQKLS